MNSYNIKIIMENRFFNYKQKFHNLKFGPNKAMKKSDLINLLSEFIEHPTKPGYKRKDIEYFIKLLNELDI